LHPLTVNTILSGSTCPLTEIFSQRFIARLRSQTTESKSPTHPFPAFRVL
jgi:hypothetical protein